MKKKLIRLQECRDIALARGGRCLSLAYIHSGAPLEWECEDSHKWFACMSKIKEGKWCPSCKEGAREGICRCIIETLVSYVQA